MLNVIGVQATRKNECAPELRPSRVASYKVPATSDRGATKERNAWLAMGTGRGENRMVSNK